MFKTTLSLLALSCLAEASFAQSQTISGRVSGTNTMDKLENAQNIGSQAMYGRYINLTVTATGSGTNKLRVRVESYNWDTKRWNLVKQMYVAPGSTSTSSYPVALLCVSTSLGEIVTSPPMRMRVSRKVGTKRINYTIRKTAGDELPGH